uniref:Uncharacterized protein n=1 Tax=Arundo donax TaxID=35708 RepID=A0A0A9BAH1_ARUDO
MMYTCTNVTHSPVYHDSMSNLITDKDLNFCGRSLIILSLLVEMEIFI